jgi:hypothetical protein
MTETSFGTELKNKLLEGVQKLNNSVASTLGPAGRTVLIKEQYGEIKVTKDGVTVAKENQELEDQTESIGSELAKKVSIKSANEVGDGTTTSTVLATAILEEGIKQINDGSNPVNIKKGIDEAVAIVVDKLKEMSTDITDDSQIKEVATISGNNDTEIGNLIATSLDKVGRDGVSPVLDSSIVTIPSRPTLSNEVAIKLPISVSLLPEIVATSLICESSVISVDISFSLSTTIATASSIPFLILTGLEPSLICLIPSSKIAVANTVEVVVPSPTSLADLIDTFLANSEPIDSVWSSNSCISFATVTPSLVTLISPYCSLIKTVLPAGPKVDATLLFNF